MSDLRLVPTERARAGKRQKKYARNCLAYAVRRQRIEHGRICLRCGRSPSTRIEGHHPDWFRPYLVLWLCPKCHRVAERAAREDERCREAQLILAARLLGVDCAPFDGAVLPVGDLGPGRWFQTLSGYEVGRINEVGRSRISAKIHAPRVRDAILTPDRRITNLPVFAKAVA